MERSADCGQLFLEVAERVDGGSQARIIEIGNPADRPRANAGIEQIGEGPNHMVGRIEFLIETARASGPNTVAQGVGEAVDERSKITTSAFGATLAFLDQQVESALGKPPNKGSAIL